MSQLTHLHPRRTFLTHCLGGLALASTARLAAQASGKPFTHVSVVGVSIRVNSGQKKTFKIYLNETHVYDAVANNGTIQSWSKTITPATAGTWGIKMEVHEAAWPYKYLGEGTARDLKAGVSRVEARAANGDLVDSVSITVQDTSGQTSISFRQIQFRFQ